MHIVAITQRPRLCSCRRIIRRNSGNSTQQQPATDHWAMCRWSQREKWEGGVEGLGGLDGVKVLVSSLLINSSPSSCDLIRTSSAMNHSCTLLTKLEVVVVGRGGGDPDTSLYGLNDYFTSRRRSTEGVRGQTRKALLILPWLAATAEI